jgi:cytochrome c-type biogenesis protein
MKELFDAFPYVGALIAGLLSFLSPCVLPLMPSYLSYITGVSFEDLQGTTDRKRIRMLTLTNSLFFVLGFSLVFISLGASSSAVGKLFTSYQDWIRIIGGVVIIFFGLFVAGILKADILQKEKRFHMRGKPAGFLGSTVVGTAFAAGWTPCIGPILGTILLYASAQGSTIYGVKLLAMYSLGLAIPFLFASLAFNSFLSYSKKIRKYMRGVIIASGVLLILFGILLLTNKLTLLTSLFPTYTVSF